MTRKHYIMFTNVLRSTRPTPGGLEYVQWARDVNAIAFMFAAHSTGFNKQQFFDAVGLDSPLERLK